jgi:hypothetical protein
MGIGRVHTETNVTDCSPNVSINLNDEVGSSAFSQSQANFEQVNIIEGFGDVG